MMIHANPQSGDAATPRLIPRRGLLLQRKCACGAGASSLTSECSECGKKKMVGLQKKPRINEPGDICEQEADQIAAQVLAAPAHSTVGGAGPRIQRFAGQSNGQTGAAPASVDRVLAGPGRPLEPALRQEMEQRFGHDFSKVRVHSDAAAEQSARDVMARAYTVGHNVVFGAGQYAPGTHDGRRLIAHELTHVVQQSGADAVRVGQSDDKRGLSPLSPASPILLQRQPTPSKRRGKILALSEIAADPKREQARKNTGQRSARVCRSISKGINKDNCPATLEAGLQVTVVAEKAGGVWLQIITPEQIPGFGPNEQTYVMAAFIEELPAATATPPAPTPWTVDELKKMLDTCDGGLGIWAKAKKANKDKDPKITPGQSSYTDSLTGDITLDKKVDKCQAVQHLIHELSNLSAIAAVDKIDVSATAGDLSRDEFIRAIEKIEYEIGVKYVLTAFDACKDKWLCQTSIMEFARKAKDFEDYFKNLLLPAHKEGYGKQWDDKFKKAYERKHPK